MITYSIDVPRIKMNNEPNQLHHRRSIRLPGFDYAQDGAYFITIVTHGRGYLFGEVIDCQMRLNDIGRLADRFWREIPEHFAHAKLYEWVVMPNHIHGVIMLNRGTSMPCHYETTQAFGKPVKGSIPVIIGLYKSTVTKAIYQTLPAKEKVWQRGYWEHVIRNYDDLNSIIDYIKLNPENWEKDEENLIPSQFPQILRKC